MTRPLRIAATYTEIHREQTSRTLIVNAGTASQRALRIVPSNRADLQRLAVAKAREKYPDAPLAWSDVDGNLTPAD